MTLYKPTTDYHDYKSIKILIEGKLLEQIKQLAILRGYDFELTNFIRILLRERLKKIKLKPMRK